MSFIKKCEICGNKFTAYSARSKYCSDNCKKIARERYLAKWHEEHKNYMQEWHAQNPDYAAKWYREHKHYGRDRSRKKRGTKAYERECEVCGKKFITYLPHQVTCSKECRKGWKWRNRDRRLKQLKGTDKYISDISLKKLIRRDEGICHICGKKIDESDYSIVNGIKQIGKLYPSIDHIIPISKGGSHTWENIQLAHLSCNCKKGSRVDYKKADESKAGSVRYF